MENIGYDLLQSIVDELCNLHDGNSKKLTRYATISRQWQYATETRIFKHCKLRTYPGELDKFIEVYSTHRHRREALRELRFTCNIPYNGNTSEENQQNQDKFFTDISTLFRTFNEWEKDELNASPGPLHLRVRCCMDPARTRRETSQHQAPSIRMEDFHKIPSVRRVTSADIHHSRRYTIHPHTSGRLLCLMPRLESAAVYFWDPDGPIQDQDRLTRRRTIRRAMADCILMIKNGLPDIKSLHVDRWGWQDPVNHFFSPESLLENGEDRLCQAIRSLSSLRHLEELKLIDVLLSRELFQDHSSTETSGVIVENSWPALKCLEISTECVATNGRWYYTGVPQDFDSDSDYTHSSSNGDNIGVYGGSTTDPRYARFALYEDSPKQQWRSRPDPTNFNPLICGLADISLRMPKLELGFFKIRTEPSLEADLVFQWVSEGKPFERLDDQNNGVDYIGDWQSRQWRITLDYGTQAWRPDDEVKEALEAWSGKGNIIIDCPMTGYRNLDF